MKDIPIEADVLDELRSQAVRSNKSISDLIRRELQVETVEVDDDVYDYLLVKLIEDDESLAQMLRRVVVQGRSTPLDPNVVEFHIRAGTGSGSWNRREEIITARVGDVLRLVNDDDVSHRLHTPGDPFPHPEAGIEPHHSADEVLLTSFEPGTKPLFDHSFGPAAAFWLRVLPAQ